MGKVIDFPSKRPEGYSGPEPPHRPAAQFFANYYPDLDGYEVLIVYDDGPLWRSPTVSWAAVEWFAKLAARDPDPGEEIRGWRLAVELCFNHSAAEPAA
jgi:hypothetical protein